MKKTGKAYFMISVVAQKYNIHPQTLRLYEREGLLKPSRTEGNTRLYSEEDLEQLETILSLTRDLGVNLAGVEIILNMRRKIERMQTEVNEFMEYVKTELSRGIGDWEQRLSTAIVKSTPTDLVRANAQPAATAVTAPTGAATLGAEGGTVQAPGGAAVVVPAGAASAPVTVRIANDATDMPALPSWLKVVGDVWTVTPHGAAFSEAVRVQLPLPARAIAANERLRIAKVTPGGEWELLDPAVEGDRLVVAVRSFSNFVPVVETYAQATASAPPLASTPRCRMVHMLWKPSTAIVAPVKKVTPTYMMMPRCSLSAAITTDRVSAATRPISTRCRVSLAMIRNAIQGANDSSSFTNVTTVSPGGVSSAGGLEIGSGRGGLGVRLT